MGTMSLCPGLGREGLSRVFLCPFGIGSPDTSLYLEMDGKLSLMTFGVKFLGCFVGGGTSRLGVLFFAYFLSIIFFL